MARNSIVAIVGQPNVGKSSLFNRMTKSRTAIVTDEPGTTRDRQYGQSEWNGVTFSVIDTGGFVERSDDLFEGEINKQVEIAVEEADLILFMVDIQAGLGELDEAVAMLLRKADKPVLLVANKSDNFTMEVYAAEFYKLGLGDPIAISAINGSGTGDLMDRIIESLPEYKDDDEETMEYPRIAVVGRPNAGKSSLINAFLGEDRHIVTDVAGTTRDSIYTHYNKFGHQFSLVDTAGIRKRGKVNEDLEYYSVLRSIRAIENSDVCVLMLDATKGIEGQDLNIFSIIQKNKKGLIVCVNKWDLIEEKTQKVMDGYIRAIRDRLAPFTDFPILFISATEKQRLLKILDIAQEIYDKRKKRISTPQLNRVLLPIIERTPPPSIKGKYIKIKYVTMLPKVQVPTFVFFCNLPQWIKEPYRRFLENQIRENWDYSGTPINVFLREK